MRGIRFGVVLLLVYVVVAATMGIGSPAVVVDAAPKTCTAVSDDVYTAVQKACGTASTGGASSVCYGQASAAKAIDDSALTFAVPGDTVDLSKIATVTTSGVSTVTTAAAASSSTSDNASSDPQWGLAMLHIQSDLPSDGAGITGVLFGDATMTSKVKAGGADLTTIDVQTVDVDPVLLRTGAGPNYPAAAKLLSGKAAKADGRLQDASWIRVRLDGALGWANVSQLKITGDVNSLAVLDKEDIDASFLYKNPMQAFTLSNGPNGSTTSANACAPSPSGLLLQLNGKDGKPTTHLLINGVDVTLAAPATALLRATPKNRFEILALQGTVTIAAQGASLNIPAGSWTRLRIGGKDGLSLTQPPNAVTAYPFSALLNTPVTLLTQALPCTVGLTANDKQIAIRGGPDDNWWTLTFMKPDSVYTAVGYAEDTNGAKWYKLDADNGAQAWVAEATVTSLGGCTTLAKVDAPGEVATTAGGGSSAGGGDSSASVTSYAPSAKSIWSADPGLDKLVGKCTTGALNYCQQMIALTPTGNSFLWKGQALKQFVMLPVKPNVYSYHGPNGTGDGTLTMIMVFTGPTTMVMNETLVLNSEPDCQHIHTFVATFLR